MSQAPGFVDIYTADLIILNNQARFDIIRQQGLVIFLEAAWCCCLVSIYALSFTSVRRRYHRIGGPGDTNTNMDDDTVLSYTHTIQY